MVLDEKNPHIRNNRDGTVFKLDVNNGVYTMGMWMCLNMPFRDFGAHTARWAEVAIMTTCRRKGVRICRRDQQELRTILQQNSTASSQTIPEESVTSIAVKEDRHQNLVSSVVVKKGIEEPWTSESVARFINSSGTQKLR